MWKHWISVSLAVLMACIFVLMPFSPAAGQDGDRAVQLIKQLGSPKYAEREKAKHDLEAMGAGVLQQLRKASADSDLEISHRAQEILKKLESKLAADLLLAPKKVKLNLKDTTVLQAIELLQKQTGYSIVIEGDQAALSKRKISLKTGEITFWEAFDKVCQLGSLYEVNKSNLNDTDLMTLLPMRRAQMVLPAQPLPIAPLPVPVPLPGAKPGPAGGQVIPAPGKGQPIPVQPAPQLIFRDVVSLGQGSPSNTITIRDGNPEKIPTCYLGSLRIRLLPADKATEIVIQPRREKEALFVLEVSAEPCLQRCCVAGMPDVEKALDDLGRELITAMEPLPGMDAPISVLAQINASRRILPRQAALRLKLGDSRAKSLKALTGSLTIQALSVSPEAVITIPEVMKSQGKIVKGQGGGSIEMLSIEKQTDGTYQAKIRLETPPQFFPARDAKLGGGPNAGAGGFDGGPLIVQQIQMQGGPAQVIIIANGPRGINTSIGQAFPVLVDAKGKVLTLEKSEGQGFRTVNGQLVQDMTTLVFRAGAGVGEPAQMVLFGHRPTAARVPFHFEGVPLQE